MAYIQHHGIYSAPYLQSAHHTHNTRAAPKTAVPCNTLRLPTLRSFSHTTLASPGLCNMKVTAVCRSAYVQFAQRGTHQSSNLIRLRLRCNSNGTCELGDAFFIWFCVYCCIIHEHAPIFATGGQQCRTSCWLPGLQHKQHKRGSAVLQLGHAKEHTCRPENTLEPLNNIDSLNDTEIPCWQTSRRLFSLHLTGTVLGVAQGDNWYAVRRSCTRKVPYCSLRATY